MVQRSKPKCLQVFHIFRRWSNLWSKMLSIFQTAKCRSWCLAILLSRTVSDGYRLPDLEPIQIGSGRQIRTQIVRVTVFDLVYGVWLDLFLVQSSGMLFFLFKKESSFMFLSFYLCRLCCKICILQFLHMKWCFLCTHYEWLTLGSFTLRVLIID